MEASFPFWLECLLSLQVFDKRLPEVLRNIMSSRWLTICSQKFVRQFFPSAEQNKNQQYSNKKTSAFTLSKCTICIKVKFPAGVSTGTSAVRGMNKQHD